MSSPSVYRQVNITLTRPLALQVIYTRVLCVLAALLSPNNHFTILPVLFFSGWQVFRSTRVDILLLLQWPHSIFAQFLLLNLFTSIFPPPSSSLAWSGCSDAVYIFLVKFSAVCQVEGQPNPLIFATKQVHYYYRLLRESILWLGNVE